MEFLPFVSFGACFNLISIKYKGLWKYFSQGHNTYIDIKTQHCILNHLTYNPKWERFLCPCSHHFLPSHYQPWNYVSADTQHQPYWPLNNRTPTLFLIRSYYTPPSLLMPCHNDTCEVRYSGADSATNKWLPPTYGSDTPLFWDIRLPLGYICVSPHDLT
jgi:hypothetical protein